MLAALAASFCAAINLVVMKKYGNDSDPFVLNFFGMGLGALGLLGLSVTFERNATVVWSTSNVAAIVYLAVFGSVVAFTLYYRLAERKGAAQAALVGVMVPVIALMVSAALEGWQATPLAVAGMALCLVSLFVATRRTG